MSSTVHTTRVDCALALGGWVVFCSCGNLTGFADDAAGADKIAADHVARADASETPCPDCGRPVAELERFPGGRCLECHASAPETVEETETMTAEKLAAMWGAKR
jgi:hypothetical protein